MWSAGPQGIENQLPTVSSPKATKPSGQTTPWPYVNRGHQGLPSPARSARGQAGTEHDAKVHGEGTQTKALGTLKAADKRLPIPIEAVGAPNDPRF